MAIRKNITKEQIVNTALDLMRDRNELRTVNMREVARTLGCAHTNIYNYFPSYTDLLWETHTALLKGFLHHLQERLSTAPTPESKLNRFFDTFVQMYLENQGWFRLAWLEYIGDERPQSNADTTADVHQTLNAIISDIWQAQTGTAPDALTVDHVVHNTHCYIIGEVSNSISGRALIADKAQLKDYIVREAINILSMCLGKR